MLTTLCHKFPIPPRPNPLTCSLLALSLALPQAADAGPNGGTITGGSGAITYDTASTTIEQATERLSIDWNSFDVAADERVTFIQPGTDSVALNRILDNDPSQIMGQIDANGHIILANPNGVIFGEGATLNVGGLVASGLQIDASDFMNGDWVFAGLDATEGFVVNRGLINAATGGTIALLGKQVSNEGLISAGLGSIQLAAAEAAVLTFDANGLLGVRITEETLRNQLGMDSAVSNTGELRAAAGQVLLTSRASQDIFSDAVNHSQPSGEMGVTVHDDGSFSLSRTADVVNSGIIDVSVEDQDAVLLQSGRVEFQGRNIEHSGTMDIGVSSATEEGIVSESTTVALNATDTVKLQGGTISSSTAFGNTVAIDGQYISLEGESAIDIGPGEIRIGDIAQSDRVYLGESSSLTASAIPDPGLLENHGGAGGTIVLSSRRGSVVAGSIGAQGASDDAYAAESQGGTVIIESLGTLGFFSNVIMGADNGIAGELTLAAHNLALADANNGNVISLHALNSATNHARVYLNAAESVSYLSDGEAANRLNLVHDLSVRANGTEESPGQIHLERLYLTANTPDPNEPISLKISMEAGSINAPFIQVDTVDEFLSHRIDVDLIAHHGSILHDAPVNILGGSYTATAAQNILFTRYAPGVHLQSGTSAQSADSISLESGRQIYLALGTAGGEASRTPLTLDAPTVEIEAIRNGNFKAEIHAREFTLRTNGNMDINAEVSGRTTLRLTRSSEVALTGDLNLLDLELSNSSLTINDRDELSFVNVLRARDSEVSIYANALRTLPERVEGVYLAGINIQRSQFNAVADHIDIRHGFSASGEGASANISFTETLTVPGSVSSSGQDVEIHFYGPESGGAHVSVVNNPNVRGTRTALGSIQLSAGDNAIDLADHLSLPLNLGDGADTITILAPDLNYRLNNFDASRDTLIPFGANNEPEPEPERPGYRPPTSQTAPTGGVVTAGSGTIDYSDNATTIQQGSDRLALDWESFNLGADRRVEFVQPDRQSIAFNNILSHDASQIFGQIDANGRVILANPNGLIFGDDASLNVGGLVASGLYLNLDDFTEETLLFTRLDGSEGHVFNYGTIHAAANGELLLVGARTSNAGALLAPHGSINLVAANALQLSQDSDGHLDSTILQEAFGTDSNADVLLSNSGALVAAAGKIKLTTRNREDVLNDFASSQNDGITLNADGSFSLESVPDILNTGTIETRHYHPLAWEESEEGLIALYGNNIAHRGAINLGILRDTEAADGEQSWVRSRATDVIIHGTSSVTLNNSSIVSLPAYDNSVALHGKYIQLTDAARIDIGPGDTVIGRMEATDVVFTAHGTNLTNASTGWPGYPHYNDNGGDITVTASQSVVVNSDIHARGYSLDGYSGSSVGGAVVLESGGLLGFDGTANLSAGSGNGTDGKLHLRAPSLTIADSGHHTLTSTGLNSANEMGVVTLRAGFDIRGDSDSPVVLSPARDLNFIAGYDGSAPGVIDLHNLTIDLGHNDPFPKAININFMADAIAAPHMGTDRDQSYRFTNIFLTAREGDIIHHSDMFTFGGSYSATAAGDIVFKPGARLFTNLFGLRGGDIQLHSDGDIELHYATEASDTNWYEWSTYTPLDLAGKNVRVQADDGYVALEVQADQLVLGGTGPLDMNASVADSTSLTMGAGSHWNLTGDYSQLSAELTGSALNLTNNNDLMLGNITASEYSSIVLNAGPGGRIEQMADSTIQLQRARLDVTAEYLSLGADGSAALITSNDESNAVTGHFGHSLALNGPLVIGSEFNPVAFINTGDNDSRVTVGEHAQVQSFDPTTAIIQMNNGNSTVDLAASMPIPIALGAGADVINLQAPDLLYALNNFDTELDTINPYIAPPAPEEPEEPKEPTQPGKPGFYPPFWGWPIWGSPVWGLPVWKPHPGFFWFGHPAFYHYPKPHSHYSPWVAKHR